MIDLERPFLIRCKTCAKNIKKSIFFPFSNHSNVHAEFRRDRDRSCSSDMWISNEIWVSCMCLLPECCLKYPSVFEMNSGWVGDDFSLFFLISSCYHLHSRLYHLNFLSDAARMIDSNCINGNVTFVRLTFNKNRIG